MTTHIANKEGIKHDRFSAKLVNFFIPKKKDTWVCLSTPDFSDNPRALYEFLRRKHREVSIIWIVADPSRCEELNGMWA